MDEVRVWAWSEGVQNFGDELGPAILQKMGFGVARVDTIEEAQMVTAGSLLEHAAQYAKPHTLVWGSGCMYNQPIDVSHLNVVAVRGNLTRQAIGMSVPTGDPGCLVPRFWSKPTVRYGVGVVRHYVDTREYSWADVVIDANQPVDQVIELIGSCERIASSSLHGLIVAHAWGIPTLRLHHPDVAGDDFKWADWLTGDHSGRSLMDSITGRTRCVQTLLL